MPPRRTRRALLRASAPAVAAAIAGCYFGPTDPRTSNRTPDEDDPPTDGTTPGSDGNDTTTDDGPTDESTPFQPRTFSFEVENSITTAKLEQTHGLAADTPATVVVDVEAHYDDREETAFERTFDLAPEATETVAEAFTTEEGPGYVIRTVLEGAYSEFTSRSANSSAGYRFTPGGFGGPTGTTFEMTVRNGNPDEDGRAIPVLTMDVPE
ncbi:hypothetical protein ACKVMT_15515 [Halobacteriales archaeon Cl-PHB]